MADEQPSATSTRAKKPVRPRAGIQRRTQAEREEFKRKEAEREAERKAAEATPAVKLAARGTRGSSRGARGGVAIHNTERTQSVATGIFGTGAGRRPDRSRAPVDIGVSEALDGSDATKPTSSTNAVSNVIDVEADSDSRLRSGTSGIRTSNRKNEEEYIPVSDDDQDNQPKRDIERIWISSDEDEDAIVGRKGKQRLTSRTPKMSFGLRPVRAAREVSDQVDDEKLGKTSGLVKSDDDNTVADVDTDQMLVDDVTPITKKDPPSSPELSKRTAKKVDNRLKDTKLLVETAEERAERLRMSGDIDKLREQFLSPYYDLDNDRMMDDGEGETDTRHTGHDRMFLFQLPPLIPQLFDPLTRPSTAAAPGGVDDAQGIQVKAEPDASGTVGEAEKDEDKEKTEPPSTVFTSASSVSERFPPGLVGKLNIHKSGKVTLDWGGTDMEVRYGTDVDFLQDVICVQSCQLPELTDTETQEQTGKVYTLGQVEKKMVLVPDWGKLYA